MPKDERERFAEAVEAKRRRREKARRESRSPFFGLGLFGLVGWSVAIPTVLGIALGVWLDKTHPGRASWTLTFLFIGVVVGCLNAWFWIKREALDKREDE